MRVTVNGEEKDLESGLTVLEMLRALGVAPERVVVELNLRILKRAEHAGTQLNPGDAIEIVHFVGGGTSSRAAN